MGRKFYLSLFVLVLSVAFANAQTGEIRGTITEAGGVPVPFASVAATINGVQVQAAVADIDGKYTIKPLNPGKYDVKATSVGYQPAAKSNVQVSVDNISFVDIELPKGIETKTVYVTEYKIPLIEAGSPSEKKTIDFEDIQAAPTRDVNSIATQAVGVYQKEEGGGLNIRGSRSDATSYYLDGIKMVGTPNVSQRGTEQVSVITGGIPAQYGDVTGGVISVTTRDPSNEWGGGLELATSEKLDAYGYNLASANVTGPLFRKRDESGKKSGQSIAGFFLVGEYQYDKDPNPSAIPIYRVREDILEDVRLHPLAPAPGGQGFIHRSSYFTLDSMQKQKYHENVAAKAIRFSGKIDIRPVKSLTLTLGGSYEKLKDNQFTDHYALMNFDNNSEKQETNWRAYAKLTQRFTSETEKSSSAIKNAYYTIQVDYLSNKRVDQSTVHQDRIFDYGYVGKFKTYSIPFYNVVIAHDTVTNTDSLLFSQIGNFDTSYTFVPGTVNPNTTNYTSQYYELTEPLGTFGYQDNLTNVLQGGALINGDNRTGLNVYGLWSTTGRIPNGYQIANLTQARVSASGSADIKNHNIMIGFEYEQRVQRGYFVAASSIWTRMRELANQSLKLHDVDSSSASTFYATVNGLPSSFTTYAHGIYTPFIDSEQDTTRGFYENVRDKFNVAYNDTIQTDSYDPDQYSLDLFTPDELFNSGNSLINYYGYEYNGDEQDNSKWDLKDFYVNKDENNNHLRKIDAFRPVYMAGYIQDRFIFNDIRFNVGVRVDRFDANQKVLKDPYSLYELHKAGDKETQDMATRDGVAVPDNIGSDYAVYVTNSAQGTSSQIVGYRNGNVWYDKFGTVITDLDPLTQNGAIQPFLTNYEDYRRTRVNPNAFTDYEPQVSVMPRVAFSFPISDEAYFAAHYDVLTQRPQNSNLIRFDPISYLAWSQGISGNFRNPNLKPEKTTVYEINFKQTLSRSSVFSITAFYKEMRDNIQFINVDYAFPIKYTTYGNIDFGTVKGLTFTYDLRRSSNVKMNLSYTLQFASGTGSSAVTNSGILSQAGQTNLREIKPLDFDQRHTFVTSFDFHYGEGKDYNGPVWFNKQFFANTGLNVVFHAGSGSPYTRKANITPEADFTTTENSRSVIAGSLNGSRYPWNFRMDAKLDKDFAIKTGKRQDGEARKSLYVNVYLQVLNVLNTLNVTTVYAATGSASDDGYLTSPSAQTVIANQPSPEAYRDLYSIKVNDPAHYDLPRRIRLGVQINF